MVFSDYTSSFAANGSTYEAVRINRLPDGIADTPERLPFSARVILENLIRHLDTGYVSQTDVKACARFYASENTNGSVLVPYFPSRVLMQDFTGVPGIVDLAAMRDCLADAGMDPERINPEVPVDLVVDHSVQVDYFRRKDAFDLNVKKEYERNSERYRLLKWAQKSFDNVRVVPPGSGICHQVNLEYLADVVSVKDLAGGKIAFPDTLIGTDSHTTMINGIGVLGWGVGGIEAEAVMLGRPYYMNLPEIIGVRLSGKLSENVTATDLVLTITRILREVGVVEKIVEFTGPGLSGLSLTDRATISNMSPEFGATSAFFPIDDRTVEYLEKTNRGEEAERVMAYAEHCGFMAAGNEDLNFSKVIDVDLSEVEPSIAGPARPQARITLSDVDTRKSGLVKDKGGSSKEGLVDGSVVIAAITSCTNTSNPHVMMGAGLLARNASEKGLTVPDYVKTSLAPGSKVVIDYLEEASLMEGLENLGFHNTGFGCTTCIGNSGPLDVDVASAIKKGDLNVASVLSGNRNFEARIHQLVKSNYLMSPMLVVAFALAGRIDTDFDKEPLGEDRNGHPVYLADIRPSAEEIESYVDLYVRQRFFEDEYSKIFDGDRLWHDLNVEKSTTFDWDPDSLYIRKPSFFDSIGESGRDSGDITGARTLLVLGDSVTTDHISPAGEIPAEYPAGQYLTDRGVRVEDFNTYGSRRGNHEVMMRGTFANIRIRNHLASKQGGYTRMFPGPEDRFVYDAAVAYQDEEVPLVVLAGKEYGTGSSRDWAAKGTNLLGVRAVLAVSFERIHRSNLVGMGVLPLVFLQGQEADTLGLQGDETIDIAGISDISPGKRLQAVARKPGGETVAFEVEARLDTHMEVAYYKSGGILHYVLKNILNGSV
ncbi:MAG: aconitate hydratase AcnA [Desulfarculaceae bacterium]|nr:aconitate hydratase AcnA [Desulfarculaceae bacterium]